MAVPRNFDLAMFSAFLRIYTQVLPSSGTTTRVLPGDVVINTHREFPEFANQITSVDCLFLGKSEFIQEPEEVSKAMPIPSTFTRSVVFVIVHTRFPITFLS